MKGYTYYRDRVTKGERFEDPKILKLANKWGNTVAHRQTDEGWTTEDPEILKLVNKYGWTVASIQIENGWKPKTKEAKTTIFVLGLEGKL